VAAGSKPNTMRARVLRTHRRRQVLACLGLSGDTSPIYAFDMGRTRRRDLKQGRRRVGPHRRDLRNLGRQPWLLLGSNLRPHGARLWRRSLESVASIGAGHGSGSDLRAPARAAGNGVWHHGAGATPRVILGGPGGQVVTTPAGPAASPGVTGSSRTPGTTPPISRSAPRPAIGASSHGPASPGARQPALLDERRAESNLSDDSQALAAMSSSAEATHSVVEVS
jgi:hypothetical protein